jgi:4-hydroxymandelate synthase
VRIQGFDHVECCVGDLEASVEQLRGAYGVRVAGRENSDGAAAGRRSALLRQGQIDLLLTCSTPADIFASEYAARHGDGVTAVAFRVDDVRQAFSEVVAAGAAPLASPAFAGTGQQAVGTALVSGFGDVAHRLVQRTGLGSEFAPGSIEMTRDAVGPGRELLETLDHVAACLPAGELEGTVRYYHDVFGLTQIFDERIGVGGQAMLSKVVQDRAGLVTFTLIEPDLSRAPGQIDEFLQAHDGAGVQHLAFRTASIADAVRTLVGHGAEFLTAPAGYYRALEARLGALAIPVSVLRELNVLADRDRWGQMFQIFAKSTHERRTLFFELIERQGALTFGSRNIKALYEALETQRAETSQLT